MAAASLATGIADQLDQLATLDADPQALLWAYMAARMRDGAARAELYASLACAPVPASAR